MSRELHFYREKVVLITGAAGGIGQGLALSLASVCEALVLVDISESRLQETIAQCKALGDVTLYSLCVDISDEQQMLAAYSTLPKDFCPDVIFANAGVGGLNPAQVFNVAVDRQIMSINYFGTVHSVAPFLSKMIKRGNGQIVAVSSLASLRGLPAAASYSASKAAMNNLMESWRLDLAPYGVQVSTFLPGFIQTAMANHQDFDMPFTVSVTDCVQIILGGTAKKKKRVLFPWPMKFLALANRMLPIWLYDWLLPIINGGMNASEAKIFSAENKD